MQKKLHSQRWSVVDTENGPNFHGSVDKIRSKDCLNAIKTVVSHVILRANDRQCV